MINVPAPAVLGDTLLITGEFAPPGDVIATLSKVPEYAVEVVPAATSPAYTFCAMLMV